MVLRISYTRPYIYHMRSCLRYVTPSSRKLYRSRPRFTNGFSIAIQIRWKFRFTLTSTLIPWSLQNFVHGTTAVLSWHVQKVVAIWWPATESWQGEFSIVFELPAKNVSETGPCTTSQELCQRHDDVMIWKCFLRCRPFARYLVVPLTKGCKCITLIFSLMFIWTNCWKSNWVAGDLIHRNVLVA